MLELSCALNIPVCIISCLLLFYIMSDVCFRAHWYLVVICYPGLEEPQYVKRDGRDSVQGDGGEGLCESEGEIHGENRYNSDEDKGKMCRF